MRKTCTGIFAGVAGVVCLSALAVAQSDAPRSPWKYYPEDARANEGPGGPAPRRDLNGTWAGESSGAGVKRLVPPERTPAFTPLGKQLFDRNKAEGTGVLIADSNDPHVRYCDPFGFPRNMNDQIRSMTVTTLPNRTFVMLRFMNIWREIWTDGRALPTNFGGRGKDVHDPTYNGYSVGRWQGDTLIIETTHLLPGMLDGSGMPMSGPETRLLEEWTVSGDGHEIDRVMTIFDPLYSRPLVRKRGSHRAEIALSSEACDPDSFYHDLLEQDGMDEYFRNKGL